MRGWPAIHSLLASPMMTSSKRSRRIIPSTFTLPVTVSYLPGFWEAAPPTELLGAICCSHRIIIHDQQTCNLSVLVPKSIRSQRIHQFGSIFASWEAPA